MTLIARGWLILNLTDSPFMVTAISAVPMAPMAIFPLFGGVVADRLNRRMILMVGDTVSALTLFGLALLLFTDQLQVWHVFALALIQGTAFSMSMPSRAALVPDLVHAKDMASGIALYTTIFSAGQLAGPAPAGFLIDSLGMAATFLFAGVIVIPALGVLLVLQVPGDVDSHSQSAGASIWTGIAEGVSYVRHQPLLVGLILMGLVFATFAMPFQAVLPIFARDVFHAGADGLGLLAALVGAGALAGSLAVAAFSTGRQMIRLMVGGSLGFGILIILFAFVPAFTLALILAPLLGFMMQLSLTTNFTLVQINSPSHLRGRVVSLRMVAIGTAPVGMLILGSGTEAFGPERALAMMGLTTLILIAGILLSFPALGKIRPLGTEELSDMSNTAPKNPDDEEIQEPVP